jgi:hypothetical protein
MLHALTHLRAGLVATLVALLLAPTAIVRAQEPPPPPSAERDSLELQVRRRMSEILKSQLGLTDDQVRQLQATNRRFEGQRRALFDQERDVRMDLRRAIDGDDTTRVGALLDRMIGLQRERLDLTEAEQRELATFMTPLQRAKLFGMEEQIRRRMMEMRDTRMQQQRPNQGRRPPGGPGRPPAGGTPRSPRPF